jgi:hypothetical protein
MANEQFKFIDREDAMITAASLRRSGKHGSVIKSRDGGIMTDSHTPVYYVETEPVGMIRTWEEEIGTF